MAKKGLLKGPDGEFYPPWEPQWGAKPPDYPEKSRRPRTESPAPALDRERLDLEKRRARLEREQLKMETATARAVAARAGTRPGRKKNWLAAALADA